MHSREVNGVSVVECPAAGPPLETEADAVALIQAAVERGARQVVIPATRLSDDFFRLKTGKAGAMLQKFVTYGVRVIIIGDIAARLSQSESLRDFVTESNRGAHIWFLPDEEALRQRLAS